MEKEAAYLSDWFIRYLKNRDLAFRRIKDIKKEDDKVVVHESKTVHYYIIPFIEDFSKHLKSMTEDHLGIVTYNTEAAFRSLVSSWDSLVQKRSLVIYFINPFSKTEKKWIIRPRTHNLISDSSSLEAGLNALYENVEPVDKDELLKILS